MNGCSMIDVERSRQIWQEEFSASRDDRYTQGELVQAAMTYASHALNGYQDIDAAYGDVQDHWPWDSDWYKPSTPVRDLIKAGALIAAEIDRLLRIPTKAARSGASS